MQDVTQGFGAEKASNVSDNYWHIVKNGVCALVAALTYWFNTLHPLVQGLMVIMATDIVLAFLRVNPLKKSRRVYNFDKGYRSFAKKAGAFLIVGLCGQLERKIPGMGQSLSSATALGFIGHFGLSALNHGVALGLPMPESLKAALSAMERENLPSKPSKKEDHTP